MIFREKKKNESVEFKKDETHFEGNITYCAVISAFYAACFFLGKDVCTWYQEVEHETRLPSFVPVMNFPLLQLNMLFY